MVFSKRPAARVCGVASHTLDLARGAGRRGAFAHRSCGIGATGFYRRAGPRLFGNQRRFRAGAHARRADGVRRAGSRPLARAASGAGTHLAGALWLRAKSAGEFALTVAALSLPLHGEEQAHEPQNQHRLGCTPCPMQKRLDSHPVAIIPQYALKCNRSLLNIYNLRSILSA